MRNFEKNYGVNVPLTQGDKTIASRPPCEYFQKTFTIAYLSLSLRASGNIRFSKNGEITTTNIVYHGFSILEDAAMRVGH